MRKRSSRVVGWLFATLLLTASPGALRAAGYLQAVGPTPLRFQTSPPPAPAPPPVVLIEPPPGVQPTNVPPAEPPAPLLTLAELDYLNSILIAPLWPAFADAFASDLLSASLAVTYSSESPAPVESPALQTVTPEMLTEFFKVPGPPPAAPSTPQFNDRPAAVFVLPSSQATYRSE